MIKRDTAISAKERQILRENMAYNEIRLILV